MKTLTAEELRSKKEHGEDFVLINTLALESFAKTRIPDSINIPQKSDDFVQRVEQAAGGKDQPVVVYCASEQCDSSPQAAKKLEQAGFTEVYDFEGGAEAWIETGGKLVATS